MWIALLFPNFTRNNSYWLQGKKYKLVSVFCELREHYHCRMDIIAVRNELSWHIIDPSDRQCCTNTRLTALCPGLPGWAGTRKVKPIWILLKPETVSGSGISWATCKSAPRSRQITTPTPHHLVVVVVIKLVGGLLSTDYDVPYWIWCLYVPVCLQCFDAVGWVAGRASGL